MKQNITIIISIFWMLCNLQFTERTHGCDCDHVNQKSPPFFDQNN